MKHLFLTGASGVGKTTVIERALARRGGEPPAGYITREVREEGRRVALRLEPLRAPESGRVFAHERFVSRERVGRYGVDVESLRYGIEVALGDATGLVVVDEVGKIACQWPGFSDRVRALLDGEHPVLGTVCLADEGVMHEVREHAEVRLLTVTPENRDALVDEVAAFLATHSG